jgi:hypothetical protein
MWITERLKQQRDWNRDRLEIRTGFLPMTEAIFEAHEQPAHYHFSNECDLINRLVLGMSSKEWRLKHGMESLRDTLSNAQLAQIKDLQLINTGLIKIGCSYAERKQKLHDYYAQKKQSICEVAA